MFRKNLPAAPVSGPQYLTAGGATVDLHTLSDEGSELAEVNAACNGCGKTEYACNFTTDDRDAAATLQRVENRLREWAQGHASTCRAVPKATR